MKWVSLLARHAKRQVALFARAWIEISDFLKCQSPCLVALFARAWIEMSLLARQRQSATVALFARAWIEMPYDKVYVAYLVGRPLCEGVD